MERTPIHYPRAASAPRYAPETDGPGGSLVGVPVQLGPCPTRAVWIATDATQRVDERAVTQTLAVVAGLLAPRLEELCVVEEGEALDALPMAGPYRSEALQEVMQYEHHGALARLQSPWVRHATAALLGLAALAAAYLVVGRVPEHVVGDGVVHLGGRAEVVAHEDGVIVEVPVGPGAMVEPGAVLVALHGSDAATRLDRLERELADQVRQLLRDPTDPTTRRAVTELRASRGEALARVRERAPRAPVRGVVRDVRVRPGQPVRAGDVLATLSTSDEERPHVLAALPGEARPRLSEGQEVTFRVEGYPSSTVQLHLASLTEDVVSADEAARRLGRAVPQDGPVSLVEVPLPEGFRSNGRDYPFHDGMRGEIEVKVRSTSILVALVPSLERLW